MKVRDVTMRFVCRDEDAPDVADALLVWFGQYEKPLLWGAPGAGGIRAPVSRDATAGEANAFSRVPK